MTSIELWNHCENPYPFVPAEVLDAAPAVRASLPNRYCDPEIAARLYDEVFDEYRLCDELGLHIVTNEHHSGINNLWAASPVITGIVARHDAEGAHPLARHADHRAARPGARRRPNTPRSMCCSRGRLDIGFVKSGATEMVSGDANPMRIREREWEAIDLIEKTLTSHDGPFSWEGKFFSHAHVNIWPRPWQQPRPEFWAATSDLPTCAELGRRSMVNTLLFGGYDAHEAGLRRLQAGACRGGAAGRPARTDFPTWRSAMSATPTRKRMRVGQKIPWFLTVSMKSQPQMSKFQPGQIAPEMAPAAWRGGVSKRPTDLSVPALIAQGQMFAGNPDTVVRQIKEFRRRVGGVGRIIMMTRQGLVTHAEAKKSFTLVAREVLPQLQDLEPIEEVEPATLGIGA